jgi:hypothetical protein
VLLGTDPEAFIMRTDGTVVQPYTLGIGDKTDKYKPGNGAGNYFRDGTAVEYNTTRPYNRPYDLYNEVRLARYDILKRWPEHEVHAHATVEIDPAELVNAPEDVQQFGCDPTFDAYKLCAKFPEVNAMTYPKRHAGAHLHFATDNLESKIYDPPFCHPEESILLNPDNYPPVVQLLDAYLGTRLTMKFNDAGQFERRKVYGQAGEFRPQLQYGVANWGTLSLMPDRKPAIGVEYRTPPPQIFDNERIACASIALGRWVIHNFSHLWAKFDKKMGDEIQLAINEGKGVEEMVARFSVPVAYNLDLGLSV